MRRKEERREKGEGREEERMGGYGEEGFREKKR